MATSNLNSYRTGAWLKTLTYQQIGNSSNLYLFGDLPWGRVTGWGSAESGGGRMVL
jgi:hypothetical protein